MQLLGDAAPLRGGDVVQLVLRHRPLHQRAEIVPERRGEIEVGWLEEPVRATDREDADRLRSDHDRCQHVHLRLRAAPSGPRVANVDAIGASLAERTLQRGVPRDRDVAR